MFKVRVKIGPTYSPLTHTHIIPNDDANPVFLDTPNFTGRICVRIKSFTGLVPEGAERIEESLWFEGNSNQYSIQVQGRFKGGPWNANQIVFGNDFDKKVPLPPLAWAGLKVLQYIDPGLEADIYADKPWAYSPIVVTMNTLRVTDTPSSNLVLPPWPSAHGEHITEGTFETNDEISTTPAKRKRLFTQQKNRESFQITSDQVWDLDFSNPYADFDKIAIRLPGFSLGVAQFWDGQPLRYVCKTRDSSAVFFVVVFELIDVEMKRDSKQQSNGESNEENVTVST